MLMDERRKRSHKSKDDAEPQVFCTAGMAVRKREWNTKGGDVCKPCVDGCEIKKRADRTLEAF